MHLHVMHFMRVMRAVRVMRVVRVVYDEHDNAANAWEREYNHADGKMRARKGWAKGPDLFR